MWILSSPGEGTPEVKTRSATSLPILGDDPRAVRNETRPGSHTIQCVSVPPGASKRIVFAATKYGCTTYCAFLFSDSPQRLISTSISRGGPLSSHVKKESTAAGSRRDTSRTTNRYEPYPKLRDSLTSPLIHWAGRPVIRRCSSPDSSEIG